MSDNKYNIFTVKNKRGRGRRILMANPHGINSSYVGSIYYGCWSDDKKYGIKIDHPAKYDGVRRDIYGEMFRNADDAEARVIRAFNNCYTGDGDVK